jgi:hypothetical protein
VGLARTYVKAQGYATPKHTDGFWQGDMSLFKTALKAGAAVASTGPLLDVTLKGTGDTAVAPGGLLEGTNAQVTLTVNLWAPDWVPVDELRVVINGTTSVLDISQLSLAEDNWRHYTGTYTLTMPSKDAWVVVEAGVPLGTTGAYRSDSAWYRTMRGIYPIAVTNPIFVDVNGGGYTAPGL